MTLRLWLVRHGQTEFNKQGIVQGWLDAPLTESGRVSLRALGTELHAIPWVGAYSSTSQRAIDSARLVTEGRIAVEEDPRWMEFNFGKWDGAPVEPMWEALAHEAGIGADEVSQQIYHGTFPEIEGGESGAQIAERITSAIADIRTRHTSGDVLVVTHGMAIGVALGCILPGFSLSTRVAHGTATVIEFDGDDTRVLAVSASTLAELQR